MYTLYQECIINAKRDTPLGFSNRLSVIYCFRELLSDCPEYVVPRVIPELSTRRVLTSELIEGTPLDRCASLDQDARNHVRTVDGVCYNY